MSDREYDPEFVYDGPDDENDEAVEQSATPFTFPFLTYHITKKDRAYAKWQADRARDQATAATMFRPAFTPNGTCAKCGGDDRMPRTRYVGTNETDYREPRHGTGEFLLRTCRRCRYEWAESVLPEHGA